MITAVQVAHYIIGKWGCYLLCLEDIAKEVGCHGNVVDTFLKLNLLGIIRDDCYLNDPAAVLSQLTGMGWSVRKEGADYQKTSDEFEVQRWEWEEDKVTGKVFNSHFVRLGFDPYGESFTVKNGKMVSKRIFRRI
jgi:hypothetical protein